MKYFNNSTSDDIYNIIHMILYIFGDIDNDNYYKPVLVRSRFKKRL